MVDLFSFYSSLDEAKLKERGRTFHDLFLTKVFVERIWIFKISSYAVKYYFICSWTHEIIWFV